jgi:ADP-heptose:LPS heptosyltransferase
MGTLKHIERTSKRALMRLAAWLVRSPKLTPRQIRAARPRRILVIRQHNQMGDMVLAIPAIRAIKASFTGSQLGMVAAPINRDVLVGSPYVDFLFAYRKRNLPSLVKFIRDIRRTRFDLVIVLHTVSFSFTSAVLALLSGAGIRVGSTSPAFGTDIGRSFFHLELPLPTVEELSVMNEAEHNIFPLRPLGIDTDDLTPEMVPPMASEKWADDFLAGRHDDGRLKLVVHPGAGKIENIWPPEKFAAVVDRLNARAAVSLFVICGPRDERPVAAFLKAVSIEASIIRDRPIGDAAALMKRVDLVLCNDTGTMHVACAVGAPTLAVFGPTNPRRWAPRSDCLFVVKAPRGNLDSLEPDPVYERALEVLGLVSRAEGDLER